MWEHKVYLMNKEITNAEESKYTNDREKLGVNEDKPNSNIVSFHQQYALLIAFFHYFFLKNGIS